MNSADIIANVLMCAAAAVLIWVVLQVQHLRRPEAGSPQGAETRAHFRTPLRGIGDLWVELLFWIARTSTQHAHAWDNWLLEYRRRREESWQPESWRVRLESEEEAEGAPRT